MLVVAGLVLREAGRRRLVLAVAILTALAILLTGWGFSRIPYLDDEPLSPQQIALIASQLTILVGFMFSFLLALSAVFVAGPAISGETESGIALAILARPISRTEYVLGKWLGLAALLLVYALGSVALALVVIRIVIDYTPPAPVEAFVFLYAEGLVLLTLALLLSTRLAGMVGGVIGLVLFGLAWMGGIVGGVGAAFDNATLIHVSTATRLILPTDGLWRAAVYSLEPAALIAASRSAPAIAAANPFAAMTPAPIPFILWTVAWIAGVLAAAIWSFRRREI